MKKILIFALCCMAFWTSNAQDGWEKIINDGDIFNQAVDFWEAPDGSFIVAYNLIMPAVGGGEGNQEIEIHLAHLDQDGTLISDTVIPNGDFYSHEVIDISALSNGNLLMTGSSKEDILTSSKLFVMEVTADGQIVWEKDYDAGRPVRIVEAEDGNFFVFGNPFPTFEIAMTKFSAIGDSLWNVHPSEYPELSYLIDAQLNADGNIYMFSRVFSGAAGDDFVQGIVSTVDFSGNLLSETVISAEEGGIDHNLFNPDFISLPLGGFAIATAHRFGPEWYDPDYQRFMVYKYNEDIELEWDAEIDSIPVNSINRGYHHISLDADENFSAIFSISFSDENSVYYNERYFAKVDQSGVILSNNVKDLGEQVEYPRAFEQTSAGDYFFCGRLNSATNDDWSFGVKLDENGNSITNEINGNLYWDENFDCEKQADEQGFEGWIIEAKNSALTYYDVADTDGNYSIRIGTGSYDLKAISPNEYWDICEGTVPVTFTEAYDTLSQDFSAQALLDCPRMWVDISTWGLRNCFDNTYTVNYCNHGTIDEDEAYIEVSIPAGMNIVSADIPYIEMTDGTLRFDIGAVAVNECGSFQLVVYVDCEVIELGETLCTEAHIYPDTLCLPGLMWTGASIQITGECDADNITYTIKNIGDAPTSQSLEYFVVEDQVILMLGNFDLNPDEEEEIILPATGATYRLEAEQEPNHPGFSMPSLAIEGCGGLTPGQVNLFSMDDNDDFIDIDCREVVASYDPNDKTGYPLGYADENFIEENTQLEYVIRFQNTGTDTAFRVVLRDTLSQFLDPTTVRAGSSSHPYSFEMVSNGVLKFSFDNILLPDSTTNEAASQGFVKFKINQRADNEIGTVINNSAAIYFDFNEPIITNETMHTIGEAFFTGIEYLIDDNDQIQASVYPNPFGAVATIEITDYAFTRGQFELFDITGRSVRTQQIDNSTFTFERNDLTAGTYAFTIALDGKKAIVGKLVIL